MNLSVLVRPHYESMEIKNFGGDEGEISPIKWFRMVKKCYMSPIPTTLFWRVNLINGTKFLTKELCSTPHGKYLKKYSQIDGSRGHNRRKWIKFKMNCKK